MPFIGRTAYCVLLIIFKNLGGKKAPYSLISVDKIIELLKMFHKISVGRRWVFYILAFLELIGFIKRQIRAGNKSDGTVYQQSSMIFFKEKGARFLMGKLVTGAKELWKRLITWMENEKIRIPAKRKTARPSTLDKDTACQRRLEDSAKMVFTPI